MEYVEVMESFESERDVEECFPNGGLIEGGACLLVCDYFLVEISVVEELHDDAEWWGCYQSELDSMKECL